MSCVRFEEIYRRPELIVLIFRQLNFQDQLRLAGVNIELKNSFKQFIHSLNYEVLNITKIPNDEFVVFNKGNQYCIVLTSEELEDFANIYADDVTELSYKYKEHTTVLGVDVQTFHNLTCLHYTRIFTPDENMKIIALNCPQLKALHMINCYSKESYIGVLQIGIDLNIATLAQMHNLKALTVEADYVDGQIEYGAFCELLTRVNLVSLKTKAQLIPSADGKQNVFDNVSSTLRELKIKFDSSILQENFIQFFKVLENLLHLHIFFPWEINDALQETLAKTCKSLETLEIEGLAIFQDVQHFSIPPNVKEITIRNCAGLTQENLQEILTEYKVRKCTTRNAELDGEFKDFAISPYIQVLDLEDVSTCKFQSAFMNNIHLKELKWHDNINVEDNQEFGDYPDPGPLESCINLKKLKMCRGWYPVEPIIKLQQLKYLAISQDVDWEDICALLKHPSLCELSINFWRHIICESQLPKSSKMPTQGFTTNVKALYLHPMLFESGLDFWFDLLSKNPDMKLICYMFEVDSEFLRRLVENVNFPKHIKTIFVWGFRLKYKDLRRNFDLAISKLIELKSFYFDSEFFNDIGRLILSRDN